MSVFCENDGKLVTIVVPERVAIGSRVKVVKCHKKLRDSNCRSCLAKHACAIFLDEPRFSLANHAKTKKNRRKH